MRKQALLKDQSHIITMEITVETRSLGISDCSSAHTQGLRQGRYDLDLTPTSSCLSNSTRSCYLMPEETRIYQYLEALKVYPVNLQDFLRD